eukprot:TRINITY_DN2523_c0_g1_i3.p3 TRINITY_DN2523_c0_g1~~TRINITY_DN2523_c0_g1_i3.p3  ORF type:complete len:107 (+),score=10.49 TRINITY_DN2523_c0_g1_i3:630-950(+)
MSLPTNKRYLLKPTCQSFPPWESRTANQLALIFTFSPFFNPVAISYNDDDDDERCTRTPSHQILSITKTPGTSQTFSSHDLTRWRHGMNFAFSLFVFHLQLNLFQP